MWRRRGRYGGGRGEGVEEEEGGGGGGGGGNGTALFLLLPLPSLPLSRPPLLPASFAAATTASRRSCLKEVKLDAAAAER